jgi:hypothetical protein
MKIEIKEKTIIIKHDKETKEVRKKPRVKSPGFRDILFFKDIVIKFDVPSRGYHGTQCKKEVEKYFEIKDEDKKYFATILDFGDGWLAQERVFFDRPNSIYRKDYVKYLKAEKILNELRDRYSLQDLHSYNWGITAEGEPIIFDYGVW